MSERAQVRRATVEGTATYVAALYRHRYLGDSVRVADRISAAASTSPTGSRAIGDLIRFYYIDAALFMRRMHARGGWPLVDRALSAPPTRSDQIFRPDRWPAARRRHPLAASVTGPRGQSWREVGTAQAGEDVARFTLSVSGAEWSNGTVTKGWNGGRLAVWRKTGSHCVGACRADAAGVASFRWRLASQAQAFERAAEAYVTFGIFGESISDRVWRVGDGFAALERRGRTTTLAFAPTERLASRMAAG
jgi:hypothetical protein